MSNTLATLALFVPASANTILELGLGIAKRLGVPTETWQIGDPTRTSFEFLAQRLANLESTYSDYIRAGFLSTASDDWLKVLAAEVYGYTAREATYATSTIELTNGGTGSYVIDAAGDLTVKSSLSDKTYHNVTGGIRIQPGQVVDVEVIADEAGSDSSAGENEIDRLVTTLVGVTVTASTPANAQDDEREESIKEGCLSSLGPLSPDGPPDVYEHIARDPKLTGVEDVTRAKSTANSESGLVTLYIAGPSGPALASSVNAVQAAVEKWATPLCIRPTTMNSVARQVNITLAVRGTNFPAGYREGLDAALRAYIATVNIGGLVAVSKLYATAETELPSMRSCTVSEPSADLQLLAGQVPVPGTITITEAP